jgi:acetolactate synthase-1/2/3 large subunit
LVSHPNQFEHKLINAIMTSFRSPMGPTHLSIPWDIFRSASPVSQPRYYLPSLITGEPVLDLAGIDQLSRQLEQARKVVLVVGADCGEAVNEILELATFLGAELVVTPHGKGFIDPYHSLFRGVIGFAGHASAREALTDPAVDTVLAIGSNFSEWASNAWDYAALLNRRLIHVDANEDHFVRSPMARLHVRGRISVILSDVLERLQQGKLAKRPAFRPTLAAANAFPIDGEAETGSSRPGCRVDDEAGFHSEATPITPQALMRELAQLFPPETCFLADTGNSQAWSVHYLHPRGLGSVSPWNHISARYQAAFEFGSMGWAIGASVGMALGFSDYCPVVCITGDGSMLMNGQEITVAVQEKLNVVFVVLNDGWLGMVKHGQRLAGAEQVAVELPRVDFYAQAKALGANAHVIHSPQDLRDLDIAAICNRRWPTLLDVRIDPEAVPPLGLRVGVLRSAS